MYISKAVVNWYELYLVIETSITVEPKARHPHANGICERSIGPSRRSSTPPPFVRSYHDLEDLQAHLDAWLDEYNRTRPHSGRYCYGKTLMRTLLGFALLGAGENAGFVHEPSAGDGATAGAVARP
jgi:hypothetical protein